MINNRLAASQQIVEGLEGDSSEVSRLLDVWLLEAKVCRQMPDASAMYSVLPWEDYGHLSTGVMLLYSSHLFDSGEERQKCRESVNVSEQELLELVRLGNLMLESEEMPEVAESVKDITDRILASSYFNAEHSGSLVLDCLDDMLRICSCDRLHQRLQTLRGKLQGIYTPTADCTVFGCYSWEQLKLGALTRSTSGVVHARAIARGIINVEEKIELLAESWPACLAAINSSPFVKRLLTIRPPKTIVPHSHALLDCIEHTWLWMLESEINVYSIVPSIKYSNLGDCDKVKQMYERFDCEVLPRVVEKNLRRLAIEAYLKGVPEADVYHGDNPALLKAMQGAPVVECLRRKKNEYMSRGFDQRCFPLEDTAWAVRDAQDLDEYSKMNCWLWDSTLTGLYLHHDLLRKGGVDDEDLHEQRWSESLEHLTDYFVRDYDRVRHHKDVWKGVSPEEAMKKKHVGDIFIPPGPCHHAMQRLAERNQSTKEWLAEQQRRLAEQQRRSAEEHEEFMKQWLADRRLADQLLADQLNMRWLPEKQRQLLVEKTNQLLGEKAEKMKQLVAEQQKIDQQQLRTKQQKTTMMNQQQTKQLQQKTGDDHFKKQPLKTAQKLLLFKMLKFYKP